MGKEFLASRVRKVYSALVFGVPKEKSGEIKLPLGYDKSSGFQTVRILDEQEGESACTRYRVHWTNEQYSFVELEPLTGRTHQLRAHMALIGHPIVGDKIYIDLKIFERYVLNGVDDEMMQRLKFRRLALHASRITLMHPRTGQETTYEADLPDNLKNFFDQQREGSVTF